MKKLLFLDVDGTLNVRPGSLDGDKLHLLRAIIDRTGAKIVICSSWRRYPHMMIRLRKALEDGGMSIHGVTPVLEERHGSLVTAKARWEEISHYLTEHPDWRTFMILDDEPDMGIFKLHHVRPNPHIGLTPELAEEVIRWFSYFPTAIPYSEVRKKWLSRNECQTPKP